MSYRLRQAQLKIFGLRNWSLCSQTKRDGTGLLFQMLLILWLKFLPSFILSPLPLGFQNQNTSSPLSFFRSLFPSFSSCYSSPLSVERLDCKKPILWLASSKILTPHSPLPPPLVWGEDTLAGWRGGCGVNILEDARHSSVLYVCKYTVPLPSINSPPPLPHEYLTSTFTPWVLLLIHDLAYNRLAW